MVRTLLMSGILLPLAAASAGSEKPNVMIIYIDDMGYSDPACFGGKFTPTPNIDAMAAEGIRLTQFYTCSPISSPSRTGLTTGNFPTRWGLHTFLNTRAANARHEQQDFLLPEAPSMARTFHENGYATAHFGKWHMGGGRDVDNAPSLRQYGFDEWASTWESPDPDPLLTASDWIWCDQDSIKRWNRTAYFIDKTLDFLKRNSGKPCFINLWPDDMHAPWVPNKKVAAEKKGFVSQPNFTSVLARLDREMGRFMQEIKNMGFEKNTIIIFSSDNGPEPSFNNTRTDGMKGQKGCLYEGGIRVPFFVRWPAVIKPGQIDEHTIMCTIDLYPTLCAMAGIEVPSGRDGEDLSVALLGCGPVERKGTLYWEFGKNLKRDPEPKFGNIYSPTVAARRGDWKVLVNHDGTALELYNLITDRNENTDVAVQNPELAQQMMQNALEWFHTSFNQYVK